MKQSEHLFEAIGLVDDHLVEEAADARRTATPWKKWAALAACLVLVIGLSASSLALLFRGCSSADTAATADSTASDTAEAPATDSTGAQESESTATTENGTATEETTTDDAVANGDGITHGGNATPSEGRPVVGPLSADADGLTVSRAVTIQMMSEENALLIRDVYTLSAADAVDTEVRYPLTAEDASYTVTVDGGEQSTASDAEGLSFPLTLEAGAEAEVVVTVTLPAGSDGILGVALPTDGGGLTAAEQTAALELDSSDAAVMESTFPTTDGTVTLQPPETYWLVLQLAE